MFRRSFRWRTQSPLRNSVVPANDRPQQPLRPSPSESATSLRLPNPERTVARDGLWYRRFVAHWQHAAAPIYCALPRPPSSPRISLRQRYPPSSPSCVLSHLLFLFSDSYISTVARFSLPLFLCFSLRCFFELQFCHPFYFSLFLFLYFPVSSFLSFFLFVF